MITTKISIRQHIAEFCYGKFSGCSSDPVAFPDSLDIYHTVWDLLQKRPANVSPNDTGNLEIVVPLSRKQDEFGKRKNPVTYNYLSARAAFILDRKIEIMMLAELHDLLDENKHVHCIEYSETVYQFMAKYGIVSITEDALIKNYYRWRNNLRRKKLKRNYTKK